MSARMWLARGALLAEVELSLSPCTDDILALQAKVEQLTREAAKMENKMR